MSAQKPEAASINLTPIFTSSAEGSGSGSSQQGMDVPALLVVGVVGLDERGDAWAGVFAPRRPRPYPASRGRPASLAPPATRPFRS